MREYTVYADVSVVVLAESESEAYEKADREITFGTDVQVECWTGADEGEEEPGTDVLADEADRQVDDMKASGGKL